MIWQFLEPWYRKNSRQLPWRNDNPDPYRVWLSEIMLQQTTVATISKRYQQFLDIFPTVHDLAAASEQIVLTQWQGLGYYSRARNLRKCAIVIVEEYDGKFPDDLKKLQQLPGIGEYTAAAVLAIAFNKPAPVLDGNIERVMSRVFDIDTPLPRAKPLLKEKVLETFPAESARDYPQALMDLAASVCTPKQPKCLICPLERICQGKYRAAELPVKPPKIKKQQRSATAYWLEDGRGNVWIRQRPDKGLLASMAEIPWYYQSCDLPNSLDAVEWITVKQPVIHVFTHIRLTIYIQKGVANNSPFDNGFWWPTGKLSEQPWPTLMKKIEDLVNI